jgi:hypothetical protein
MIVAPGGVKTKFHDSLKTPDRHPAYANDPETPLNGLMKFIEAVIAKGMAPQAPPERVAEVVFDVVVGQNERPLPGRLSLGAETLKLLPREIDTMSKELKDWEDVTVKVTPKSDNS